MLVRFRKRDGNSDDASRRYTTVTPRCRMSAVVVRSNVVMWREMLLQVRDDLLEVMR